MPGATGGMSADAHLALETGALRLLREWLALDAEARAQWLAAREADDPRLAARLRALIAHVDEDELQPAADAADAPCAGERLGPYRVLERIGSGGMGEVYRALRDDGSFEREVALKRIWGGYAPLTERFLRERRVLARLAHPHIAQLLDAGADARGQPWFAMELVRGEPITRWCDARNATLAQRVQLFEQVCDAVDVAHRNLVVHRDLKPGNVLVDADGQAKLLDFGIAKLLDEADAEATRTLAMTPAWAAPEQRRGDAVTTATDLWQLGMLLKMLLAGGTSQDARLGAGYRALRLSDASAAEAVARARGSSADRLERELRGDLEHIVALATADDPRARYPSARALADDLRRWREGRPVLARRDERGYRARRWAKRYWPALAAAVAALGFLGYHVHSLDAALQRTRAERARALAAEARALAQQRVAEQQRDQARNLADYFDRLFDNASPQEIERGDVGARQLLQRSIAALRQDRRTPPATRARLMLAGASALAQLNHAEEAMAATQGALDLLRQGPDADADALAAVHSALATRHNDAGRYPQARAAMQQGLALYDQRRATDPVAWVQLEQMRGMLAQRDGDKDGARASYAKVVALTSGRERDALGMARSRASALTNLAKLEADPVKAEAMLRESLALLDDNFPGSRELRYAVAMNLAAVLMRRDRLAEASTLIEDTLAAASRHYNGNAPWLGVIHVTAGKIDRASGREARAEARLRRGRDILGAALGANNPVTLRAQQELVFTLLATGDAAARREWQAWRAAQPDDPDAPAASAGLRLAQAILACAQSPSAQTLAQVTAGVQEASRLGDTSAENAMLADWAARCRARLPAGNPGAR